MSKRKTTTGAAIPERQYAFPRLRKEPLEDADHGRSAIARFDQVTGANEAERFEAWERIQNAARKYGVEILLSVGSPGAPGADVRLSKDHS